MKINKKIIVGILILLVFSYVLLFMKIGWGNKVECTLTINEINYQKKQTIVLNYREDTIKKIKQTDIFESNVPKILNAKKEEYIEKGYKVKESKEKLEAKKSENVSKNYEKVIKQLLDSGYTCR